MGDLFSLVNITCPVGSIVAFAGNVEKYTATGDSLTNFSTQPIESFGWMLCDGSAISASQYPELYAALGDLYGSSGTGDEMTFNLPDLRGQFLRGLGTDQASNESRTAAKNGKQNGVGSTQKDALQTHQHQYGEPTGAMPGDKGSAFAAINPNAYTGPPTSEKDPSSINVSKFETRPTNIFVNFLIKYTYRLPQLNSNHLPIATIA